MKHDKELAKNLRKVLADAHIPHSDAENKSMRDAINRMDAIKSRETLGVQASFSSEGGLSIPYAWLGIPGFGEWLHLRFHEDHKGGWVMGFHPNTYKHKMSQWSEEERIQVYKGTQTLLKAAQALLDYVRNPGTREVRL